MIRGDHRAARLPRNAESGWAAHRPSPQDDDEFQRPVGHHRPHGACHPERQPHQGHGTGFRVRSRRRHGPSPSGAKDQSATEQKFSKENEMAFESARSRARKRSFRERVNDYYPQCPSPLQRSVSARKRPDTTKTMWMPTYQARSRSLMFLMSMNARSN